MRERFWNKHDFESALILEVSNETYSQMEFCYLILESNVSRYAVSYFLLLAQWERWIFEIISHSFTVTRV